MMALPDVIPANACLDVFSFPLHESRMYADANNPEPVISVYVKISVVAQKYSTSYSFSKG